MQEIAAETGRAPLIGNARGAGQLLVVIQMHPAIGDVGELYRIEIELAGDDVPAFGFR